MKGQEVFLPSRRLHRKFFQRDDNEKFERPSLANEFCKKDKNNRTYDGQQKSCGMKF
jgi:hypothetical protein